MKRKTLYSVILFLQIGILVGCSKPDKIATFKMPDDEISFTIETSIGHGAISSDYTNVYAHLARNGKADKKEVLSGENLEITKIIWLGPNEAAICLVGGITVSFANYVTLRVNDNRSRTIRIHLQENAEGGCPTPPAYRLGDGNAVKRQSF